MPPAANGVLLASAALQIKASGAESVSPGSSVSGSAGYGENGLYGVALPSAGWLNVEGQSGFFVRFRIYDASCNLLDMWYECYYSVSGRAFVDELIYLTKGAYYVEVANYGGSGSSEACSFRLSFSSSGASFSGPKMTGMKRTTPPME